MIKAKRRIHWCCGHRVHGHENKCANLHGHNYVAHIEAVSDEGEALDGIGRVVDFSVLKQCSDPWIQEEWDHSFLVWKEDPLATILGEYMANKPLVICDFNPTAENMAVYIAGRVQERLNTLGHPVRVSKVTVHETENCQASYETI